MRILLINPNRYKFPPVPPIGIEYISCSMEHAGHEVEVLDLCFSDDIYKDIEESINIFKPEIVGLSVRNIDSVLYHNNEFFLEEMRDIVKFLKYNFNLCVIVGGTGLSTNPEGVVDYLGADVGIVGPAEETINILIEDIKNKSLRSRIYHGVLRKDVSCKRKIDAIDYKIYYENGGIAGFETHKGCSSSCPYCIEANKRVFLRDIDHVISEIKDFVSRGYNHFHLCDSEFNEDLDYSIEFCESLKRASLDIKWTAYMKPSEFSKRLLKLMRDTGVYLITLTVDSYRKCTMYWSDVERFVFTAKPLGIKVVIDFLTGFPYEKEEEICENINLLKRLLPDKISVNTYIRLYSSTQITKIIRGDPELKKYLIGNIEDDSLIRPVFYNHITSDDIKKIIGEDPLFIIEGIEKGVNYCRV
jgi:radical SAM superfamily enzyme YgiQ (UPF0313 family)